MGVGRRRKYDMKNVILIHGYNGIPKIYEWLKDELEKLKYNVILPEFPPREGVIYEEWKKIFDQYRPYIDSDSIIVAHSIGNEFIIKYMNENDLNTKLYISLAGFSQYFEREDKQDLNRACRNFLVSKNELENFKAKCNKRYSIYFDNDHLVPFDILEQFPKSIDATPILIENIGHMGKKSGVEKIPQIMELINMDNLKNIMITGTITSAKEDSMKIYEILVEELTPYANNIYSPIDTIKFKGTNEEMYKRAMRLLQKTDLVIAEMSNPSTGQGMELQEAVRLNIPIIIVAKKESKISSTVLGSGKIKETFFYDNKKDIKDNLSRILNKE